MWPEPPTRSNKRFFERVLDRAVRVIRLSLPVLRRLVRRALAVMPESDPFTPVMSPPTSRTPSHDAVSNPVARQSSRFAPDITFFMTHTIPMTRFMTELMTILIRMMSLITALLFHIISVMSVMTALMNVIIAVMWLIIGVMTIMTAMRIDMTEVMSILIRMMCLIIGMTWIMKKVMSILIAMRIGPALGAESPPSASR